MRQETVLSITVYLGGCVPLALLLLGKRKKEDYNSCSQVYTRKMSRVLLIEKRKK